MIGQTFGFVEMVAMGGCQHLLSKLVLVLGGSDRQAGG
jgi:hypothetical protein